MMGLDIFEPLNQYYQISLHKKNKTLFSLNYFKSGYLFLMAEQYKYNICFKDTNFEFLKTLSPTFYNCRS